YHRPWPRRRRRRGPHRRRRHPRRNRRQPGIDHRPIPRPRIRPRPGPHGRGVEVTQNDFELTVGEVTAMEARVQIRLQASAEDQGRVPLRGALRAPYCEPARTPPAEYPFHKTATTGLPTAEAVVPDPCLWSPDLPHLYHADVEALDGNRVVAEYHGQ